MNETPQPGWAEAAEARLVEAALPLAQALGWSDVLVARAAAEAGLSADDAALLLPGGPRDLAALLSRRHDQAALAALADIDPFTLKVRERIRRGVAARVEAAAADMAAVKRAAAFTALPSNLGLGTRLLWESADRIWRWAGDTATDENHYSKRAILSGVIASTLGVRFTRGAHAAEQHLERAIERVMAFEKWKARLPSPLSLARDAAGLLGGLRSGRREPVSPPPALLTSPEAGPPEAATAG
jgi:ubiquinone biosynthesis protein COQ9